MIDFDLFRRELSRLPSLSEERADRLARKLARRLAAMGAELAPTLKATPATGERRS